MKTKLFFLLIFFTFYSCCTQINDGVITDKHFKAKHSVPMPKGIRTVPDSYKITFEKDTVIKIQRTIIVNKEVYNSHQVGDSIKIR